jgi:hypothetical protein
VPSFPVRVVAQQGGFLNLSVLRAQPHRKGGHKILYIAAVINRGPIPMIEVTGAEATRLPFCERMFSEHYNGLTLTL